MHVAFINIMASLLFKNLLARKGESQEIAIATSLFIFIETNLTYES